MHAPCRAVLFRFRGELDEFDLFTMTGEMEAPAIVRARNRNHPALGGWNE